MKKALNILLSVVFILAVFVATVTFSIGLPIYVRPFYYSQIEPLGIPETTGHSVEEIKNSYDQVLDYLTLSGDFGTGVFKHSEDGKGHFEDCKFLFDLNFTAFVLSGAVISLLLVLDKLGKIRLLRIGNLGVTFLPGVSTVTILGTLAGLVASDFDLAFKVFHAIFFPGKDNWIFKENEDEIILALPQEFFLNCAILIASSAVLMSLILIVVGIFNIKKVGLTRKNNPV